MAISGLSPEEIKDYDLICVTKKPDLKLIDYCHGLRKPLVFDIVDSWAQPDDGVKCNGIVDARALFQPKWERLRADGYIFPTKRMRDDLGCLVPCSTTIYHHFRPTLELNPVRPIVRVVGYEGGDYLGEWGERIAKACESRGLTFVVNPENYRDLDVVILARGGLHGNFLSRNYKSNVKLANAFGSGTPALVHFDEMSAHDTDTGDVLFFTDLPGSFERQLDRLIESHNLRIQLHCQFLRAARSFHISVIAAQFERFFLAIMEHKQNSYV